MQDKFFSKFCPVLHKRAFTLAEVLITLGIIGVVAAMTIPVLLNNAQDMQYKSAWKKTYSQLSQAIMSMVNDNGGSLKNLCPELNGYCVTNYFKQFIKIPSVCGNNSTFQCMDKVKFFSGDEDTTTNALLINTTQNSIFNLLDGVTVFVRYHASNCAFIGNNNSCGWIIVDVNGGKKPPNIVGKDIYFISIKENRLLPYGSNNAHYEGVDDCDASGNGFSCAAKYLYSD